MMKHTFLKVAGFIVLLTPTLTFALASTFKGVICDVVGLLQILVPILFGLALILFFWGLSKFIINSSGNEKELQTGKNYMYWGIIAMFVLFTFRAIIGLVTNDLGFGDAKALPFLPGSASVCGPSFGVDTNFIPTPANP